MSDTATTIFILVGVYLAIVSYRLQWVPDCEDIHEDALRRRDWSKSEQLINRRFRDHLYAVLMFRKHKHLIKRSL